MKMAWWRLLSLMLLILEGTKAAFTFTLHLDSFEVNDVPCDTLTACDPYFNLFCLREGRSYESHTTDDCPLGVSNSRLDKPGTVVIQSSSDWKGGFQLLIRVMDDDVIQDDHLDFIFVEGYLRNNSLSLPMTFTGFENAAELSVTVRFQRVCDDNFHGVACTTFCDPTNGSYECSANGSKICLPGYGNPDNNCLENIDDCSSDPCHNGGSCTDLVANFSCSCTMGFSGRDCSVDIDECQEAVCPGNSTCVDSVGNYTCACDPGFTGLNCSQVIDPCNSDPCRNGGTCAAANSTDFRCLCPDGYTGVDCEVNIDDCLTTDCAIGTAYVDGVHTNQKPVRTVNGVVIGSVVGVVFVLIIGGCIILLLVLIVIGVRRRSINSGRRFSKQNDYAPASLKSDQLMYNSLYGMADDKLSDGQVSSEGSLHVCDNALYSTGGEEVLYEEPGTVSAVLTSPNRSYERLKSSGSKKVQNPLYGTGTPPTIPLSTPDKQTFSESIVYDTVDRNSPKLDVSLATQNHKTESAPSHDESSYEQLHHNISRHQQRDVEKPVLLSANDQLNYEHLQN